MRHRHEFSAKVKAAAALRAAGKCEDCGRRLLTGDFHFDHEIPDALGGENTIQNCRVLCKSCHVGAGGKTSADIKRIAKAKRNFRKAHGIKKPRTITRWRKFDGSIVVAPRER